MPITDVRIFCEADGKAPLLPWLARIPVKPRDKLRVRIGRLEELGNALVRPEADFLRDGIYELRVRFMRVNYRILYFFHGKGVAILSHGLTKEDEVPDTDIDRAIERALMFKANPTRHTYKGAV
jgi:phage-related protein